MSNKEAAEILRATQALLVLRVSPSPFVEALEAGAVALEEGPITKHTSDGHHTFEELYEHRFELWMAVCRLIHKSAEHCFAEVWRCKQNSDGSSWDGWFLLGIDGREQITYHLPIRLWDRCGFAKTYDEPHAWDGHTSADVLERLKTL